jgi:hypothetical protein
MGRVMILGKVMVLGRVLVLGVMVLRPGIIVQGEEMIVLGRVIGPRVMPVQGGAMVMTWPRVRFLIKRSAPARKSRHVIRKLCYGTIETMARRLYLKTHSTIIMCIFHVDTSLPFGINEALGIHVTVSGSTQIEGIFHAISHAMRI